MLVSNKKEHSTDACYDMEEPHVMLRKRGWTQETTHRMVCLYEISRKGKAVKTENRFMVAWGRGLEVTGNVREESCRGDEML